MPAAMRKGLSSQPTVDELGDDALQAGAVSLVAHCHVQQMLGQLRPVPLYLGQERGIGAQVVSLCVGYRAKLIE